MTKLLAFISAFSSFAVALGHADRAEAACDTTGTDKAYGDFWVERASASCNCEVKQRKYDCVASGGFRAEGSVEVVATVTGGSCAVPCELTAGYDTAVAVATGNWHPSATNYECDTVFTDADEDGYGVCVDEDDNNPRKWVKINASEKICDGADNDNDGTVDDGFTACPEDHKRFAVGTLYQGNGSSAVNLVSGALRLAQTDVVVQGPFGPLALTRVQNSRRNTNDASMGKNWTHNYAVYLKQQPSGDDRWRVQLANGEHQYFRCQAFGNEMGCSIDDHHLRGNLRRTGGIFYYYPSDGTVWTFSETNQHTTYGRNWSLHEDGSGNDLAVSTIDATSKLITVLRQS